MPDTRCPSKKEIDVVRIPPGRGRLDGGLEGERRTGTGKVGSLEGGGEEGGVMRRTVGTRAKVHRRRRGASATELALLLPLLTFMLLGAIDFCRLFYAYTTITNCARNGALWASDPLASTQSPYPSLFEAVGGLHSDAFGLNPALTSSNITQTSGTDGQGNATVIVTVTYQFNLMTLYLGFGSVTLSRRATMRVEPAAPN